MIVFSLKCANGHVFDEWFRSSAEYEARRADLDLACPTCGDHAVEKAIMAPRVNSGASPEPACAGGCASAGACPYAAH
jgi:hypothetical protein